MDTLSIYDSIYNDVFRKTFSQTCYVFLCGGAGKEHIRNKVRRILEKENFQILYPEDLFMDMLNRNSKSDLLEYENFLADNADIICVICESMGSAVELGAFVQNEAVCSKLVVAINQKYERDKSFIMMGPVKHIQHLQKKKNDQYITYKQNDPAAMGEALTKCFNHLHKDQGSKKESFAKLSTYIAFIPVVIYFFEKIRRPDLYNHLNGFLKSRYGQISGYANLFNVAIKYLQKTGILVTEFDNQDTDSHSSHSSNPDWNSILSLSQKGFAQTRALLMRCTGKEKTFLQDRIRCAILKEQLHTGRSF